MIHILHLEDASLEMKDVDHVVVATNNLFWRPEPVRLEDYFRKTKGLNRDLFLSSGSFFAKLTKGSPLSRKVYYQLKSILTRSRRTRIREVLETTWGYKGDLTFLDHLLAHCASAYFTSGLSDATVMS